MKRLEKEKGEQHARIEELLAQIDAERVRFLSEVDEDRKKHKMELDGSTFKCLSGHELDLYCTVFDGSGVVRTLGSCAV